MVRWIVLAGLAGVLGCASEVRQGTLLPAVPRAAKCTEGASQRSVMVAEWSASERATLETMLSGSGGGAVAVAYTGCELRVITQCRLPGTYAWQRTTTATERVDIRTEGELFAKLPLGAMTLGADLARYGDVAVISTIGGQARLEGASAQAVPSDPSCAEATHLVETVSVGAFAVTAAGNTTELRGAGRPAACSDPSTESWPRDCATPVQVALTPIPGRVERTGPPGTVRAFFQSTEPQHHWKVKVDDAVSCVTPCDIWVGPLSAIVLEMDGTMPGMKNQKVSVPALPVGEGTVQVAAAPRSNPKFVGGLVATTFGGLGVATGITLVAVGRSIDHKTMFRAGQITLPASAALLALGIYFLVDARPRVEVTPLLGGGGVRVAITPLGIVGEF